MKSLALFCVIAAILPLGADVITTIDLQADRTIDVPAGSTVDVARVTGGDFTITKTGEGLLRFGWLRNTAARLIVSAGAVEFYRPPKPDCVANAFLHVDANVLNPAFVSTENGTNFVSRWEDASGGAHYATVDATLVGKWRTEATIAAPFVLKGYQNGLDVLDFGHYQQENITNAQGVALYPAAAMNFDTPCKPVGDVFAVIGYRDEIKTVYADYGCSDASPLLSYRETWAFLPGKLGNGTPPLFNYWQKNVAQALLGKVVYNDAVMSGTVVGSNTASAGARPVPEGLFYLNVSPAHISEVPADTGYPQEDNTGLNAFARDRSNNFGGQRIGEYIIFEQRLSESDRIAVENYLRVKWFPLQQTFRSVSVAAGASFKSASGKELRISSLSAGSDISVESGRIVVDALHDSGAWIHLDAANAATLQTSLENGKTLVARWDDAEGGPRHALHCEKSNSWRNEPAGRKPFMTDGVAANNLPVVDFGYPQNPNITNEFGQGIGYGAAMNFDVSCTKVRETLAVVADRADALSVSAAHPGSNNNSASFIGGRISGCVNFFREAFSAGENPPVLSRWHTQTKGIWGYAQGIAVDGIVKTPANAATTGSGPKVCLPDNALHLLNLRMSSDGGADGLAHDANYAYGGVQIAEVMIFEHELDDSRRANMAATLMSKWMGSPAPVYACGTVSVARASALAFPHAALSAARLELGGSLAAAKASAAVLEIVSSVAEVDGVLDLSTPGALVVDRAHFPFAKAGDTVRLAAASSVTGDPAAWKVSGSLADRFAVRLSARDDGLYARLDARSFALLLY